MKDVLHILTLLKRRAEADLSRETRRRSDVLANMDAIKIEMAELNQNNMAVDEANSRNYTNWLSFQKQSLMRLSGTLPKIDMDIKQAFEGLEQVQAKLSAAEKIYAKQVHEIALEQEAIEDDAMLELSLLRKMTREHAF